MKVTENIRHGRNSQTRETYVNDQDMREAVSALLLTSPYVYQRPDDTLLTEYVDTFTATGMFQHGWSDFETTTPTGTQLAARTRIKQEHDAEMQRLLDNLGKKTP